MKEVSTHESDLLDYRASLHILIKIASTHNHIDGSYYGCLLLEKNLTFIGLKRKPCRDCFLIGKSPKPNPNPFFTQIAQSVQTADFE